MPNLDKAPTHKIEDRKAILLRVLDALLADPNCRYAFSDIRRVTVDEIANWEARETVSRLSQSFKVATHEPPVTKIEALQDKPTDDSAEA